MNKLKVCLPVCFSRFHAVTSLYASSQLQLPVHIICSHQILMGTHGTHCTAVQNQNIIRIRYCFHVMGNHENGLLRCDGSNGLVDCSGRFYIQIRGNLIQKQQVCSFQQSVRNHQPSALSAGEVSAVDADLFLQSLWKSCDKLICTSRFQCVLKLGFAHGTCNPIEQILPNGS